MQLLLTDVTGQSFPELMRFEPAGAARNETGVSYQQPLQEHDESRGRARSRRAGQSVSAFLGRSTQNSLLLVYGAQRMT